MTKISKKLVSPIRIRAAHLICLLLAAACMIVTGCRQEQKSAAGVDPAAIADAEDSPQPCVIPQARSEAPKRTYDIPRFAADSPFDKPYESPIPSESKRIWATSRLWEKAPDFVVEKWLTDQPDIAGKYLLIEFWATWCSQCRRAAPLLNDFHRKFADDLVVIGISDENEETIRNFADTQIQYYHAIDSKAAMKTELAVVGIPHCIIVEPGGYVVWEGFPLLGGHELTEDEIARIIAVGRKQKAAAGK